MTPFAAAHHIGLYKGSPSGYSFMTMWLLRTSTVPFLKTCAMMVRLKRRCHHGAPVG
jgi:hypothetical protein